MENEEVEAVIIKGKSYKNCIVSWHDPDREGPQFGFLVQVSDPVDPLVAGSLMISALSSIADLMIDKSGNKLMESLGTSVAAAIEAVVTVGGMESHEQYEEKNNGEKVSPPEDS